MEVRPIDANAFKKQLRELLKNFDKSPTKQYVVRTILSMLGDETQTPTLDYEPVVNCKDCGYWSGKEIYPGIRKCENRSFGYNIFTRGNDFCSYGVKMDEEIK